MAYSALFSITYLGPVEYYAALLRCPKPVLEARESFPKQSYRNRCYLAGPNGALMLSLPVARHKQQPISEVALSFHENWPAQHWQSLQSCLGQSPFWEALAPELEAVYQDPPRLLWDFNLRLMNLMFKFLRQKAHWQYSEEWQKEVADARDWRAYFHPKKTRDIALPPYPQVFDQRHGFLGGLSVLDLLCNEGPAALDYLQRLPDFGPQPQK